LRAKAVYDGFVNKYCNITFQATQKKKPLEESSKHSLISYCDLEKTEREGRGAEGAEFGMRLKQKTTRSLSKENSLSRF
jgi:hypothetical protein